MIARRLQRRQRTACKWARAPIKFPHSYFFQSKQGHIGFSASHEMQVQLWLFENLFPVTWKCIKSQVTFQPNFRNRKETANKKIEVSEPNMCFNVGLLSPKNLEENFVSQHIFKQNQTIFHSPGAGSRSIGSPATSSWAGARCWPPRGGRGGTACGPPRGTW